MASICKSAKITAKYDDVCTYCGKHIPAGKTIWVLHPSEQDRGMNNADVCCSRKCWNEEN